jgi:hypothetical protein
MRTLVGVCPPEAGHVRFGDFARTVPMSTLFGYDRGTPIDRIYVDAFLNDNASHIRGRTLEVVDDHYTLKYGAHRTTKRDVVDFRADNPKATIVGDLCQLGTDWDGSFDAIVLTQTLQLIYDLPEAVRAFWSLLDEEGTILLTVPGLTPIDRGQDYSTWYWAFTETSAFRLFSEVFGADNVEVSVFGNVFTAVSFLHGLAAEELAPDKLFIRDPHLPVTIGIRATKSRKVASINSEGD